jgi:hypothetical protein
MQNFKIKIRIPLSMIPDLRDHMDERFCIFFCVHLIEISEALTSLL